MIAGGVAIERTPAGPQRAQGVLEWPLGVRHAIMRHEWPRQSAEYRRCVPHFCSRASAAGGRLAEGLTGSVHAHE